MFLEYQSRRVGCGAPMIVSFVAIVLFLCASCRSTKNSVSDFNSATHYETIVVRDTIERETRDSIFHTIYIVGDTVYNTKYVEKVVYKDKKEYRTDTIYIDKIRTETTEKVIEKTKIPKWSWFCLAICVILSIFAGVKAYTKWLR